MMVHRRLGVMFYVAFLLFSVPTGLLAQSENKGVPAPAPERDTFSACPQCDLLARVVAADLVEFNRLSDAWYPAHDQCDAANAEAKQSKSRADQAKADSLCSYADSIHNKFIARAKVLTQDEEKLGACNKKCSLPIPRVTGQKPVTGGATKNPIELQMPSEKSLNPGTERNPEILEVPGAK